MSTLITVIHVITCLLLVLMVLVQSGKGAEISASFGGSSQTVFGSSGGANVFVKVTAALATIFFVTSLILTIYGGQNRKSIFEEGPFSTAPVKATQKAPVAPQKGAPQTAAPTTGAKAVAPAHPGAPTTGSSATTQKAPPAGAPAHH